MVEGFVAAVSSLCAKPFLWRRQSLILLSIAGLGCSFQNGVATWSVFKPSRSSSNRHLQIFLSPGKRRGTAFWSESSSNHQEPDLFDYFDPTLSPHAYPNGISPDHSPLEAQNVDQVVKEAQPPETTVLPKTTQPSAVSSTKEPDLFDYFDPLLSPHAYPNGISPENTPVPKNNSSPPPTSPNSLPMLDLLSATYASKSTMPAVTEPPPTSPKATQDLLDVFDPRLSPHAYPNGIPSTKMSTKTIGILLMDHGSRNSASNQRLQQLAELYQSFLDNDSQNDKTKMIVRAAHMEIADPSIPQMLKDLSQENVDEIVCHPFFLSPEGRHSKEDIPRIVQDAVEDLQLTIPVTMTPVVGNDMNAMIQLIHSIVQESSCILQPDSK